ncbi:hypothetical protein M758_10G179300 [Ceratodon purpureus]|nr:hypothetical protein M758_10G179300 [Ceratodon purpureus]
MDHVWNFRGVNNTCWHRVKVKLKMPCVPCFSQTCLLTLSIPFVYYIMGEGTSPIQA